MRALFAVQLPSEVFSEGSSRRWLRSLTTGSGLGFRFGEQVWIGVIMGSEDKVAASRAQYCLTAIREQFSERSCHIAWVAVSEEFRLTTAAIRGKTPPPFVLLELLEQVAGA